MNRPLPCTTYPRSSNRFSMRLQPLFHDSSDAKSVQTFSIITPRKKTKSSCSFRMEEYQKEVSSPRKKSTGRFVTFDPKPKIHASLSRDDYTFEEMVSCWYPLHERERMSRERQFDIQCLEAGVRRKSRSFRGLERWTKDGNYKEKRRYRILIDAIMSEQEHNICYNDPANEEKLASISTRVSLVAKASALQNARKDQREALKASCLFEVGNSKRRELLLDNMESFKRRLAEAKDSQRGIWYDDTTDEEEDIERERRRELLLDNKEGLHRRLAEVNQREFLDDDTTDEDEDSDWENEIC